MKESVRGWLEGRERTARRVLIEKWDSFEELTNCKKSSSRLSQEKFAKSELMDFMLISKFLFFESCKTNDQRPSKKKASNFYPRSLLRTS